MEEPDHRIRLLFLLAAFPRPVRFLYPKSKKSVSLCDTPLKSRVPLSSVNFGGKNILMNINFFDLPEAAGKAS